MSNLTFLTKVADHKTGEHVPAKGRRKVFISYKKTDNGISNVRDITAHKILDIVDCAIWYDEKLTPGVEYNKEIIDAITECDALVLLLTKNILSSNYVWNIEVKTAREQKKGIIPIAFDISNKDYATAEKKLGSKIEIMRWPTCKPEKRIDDSKEFEALERAIKHFVTDADLALRVEQFFASKNHERSAIHLNPSEKYLMGYGYLKGIGIKKDTKIGVKWLDIVTDIYGDDAETKNLKGNAALNLLYYYYNLNDYKTAVKYAEKGMNAGNTTAIRMLGYMYSFGKGVTLDKTRAAKLYSQAAELGDIKAMRSLALMYKNGDGIPSNMNRAIELFSKAAKHKDSISTFQLGLIYKNGTGVSQNKSLAGELFSKASELGNSYAMYNLGLMYQKGDGIALNKSRAAKLFSKASELGNSYAMYSLGLMYQKGDGIALNKSRAAEFFSKASELGNSYAMYSLGLMYQKGDGIPQNKPLTVELFSKASELGNSYAMLNLGDMYYNGDGIDKNIVSAFELFSKASILGNEAAKERINAFNLSDKKKATKILKNAEKAAKKSAQKSKH